MRADSLATKGWIRCIGIEVATAGRISPILRVLIEYVCTDYIIAWLERKLDIKARIERCQE